MAVPPITGALSGSHAEYAWLWSNKSTIARYGALMAHLTTGGQFDVICNGEANSGKIIGPCLKGPPEGTTNLNADGTYISTLPIAERPAHAHYLIAPNNAVAVGDFLIPTGATGQVKPRPAGSNTEPVAKALEALASTGTEQLLKAEVLTPGQAAGGFWVSAEGTDTLTANRFVALTGAHVAPGAAKNTPIVLQAIQDCVLSNFRVGLDVAAGGGKTVTYNFKKGATAALANAAAASLTLAIVDPALTNSDNTNTIAMSAGEVLVIQVTSADVGAAEHSRVAFKVT